MSVEGSAGLKLKNSEHLKSRLNLMEAQHRAARKELKEPSQQEKQAFAHTYKAVLKKLAAEEDAIPDWQVPWFNQESGAQLGEYASRDRTINPWLYAGLNTVDAAVPGARFLRPLIKTPLQYSADAGTGVAVADAARSFRDLDPNDPRVAEYLARQGAGPTAAELLAQQRSQRRPGEAAAGVTDTASRIISSAAMPRVAPALASGMQMVRPWVDYAGSDRSLGDLAMATGQTGVAATGGVMAARAGNELLKRTPEMASRVGLRGLGTAAGKVFAPVQAAMMVNDAVRQFTDTGADATVHGAKNTAVDSTASVLGDLATGAVTGNVGATTQAMTDLYGRAGIGPFQRLRQTGLADAAQQKAYSDYVQKYTDYFNQHLPDQTFTQAGYGLGEASEYRQQLAQHAAATAARLRWQSGMSPTGKTRAPQYTYKEPGVTPAQQSNLSTLGRIIGGGNITRTDTETGTRGGLAFDPRFTKMMDTVKLPEVNLDYTKVPNAPPRR